MENYKRIHEIGVLLGMDKTSISYRIKELGIVATNRYWYDEYQIELIRDFERSPRTKYIIVESKMNEL